MFIRSLLRRNVAAGIRSPSVKYPNVPEGMTGTNVFPFQPVRPCYSLPDGEYFTFLAAGAAGAFSGHFFYIKFLMGKNPPHPPRDPNEPRPEAHPHTVDEDDD